MREPEKRSCDAVSDSSQRGMMSILILLAAGCGGSEQITHLDISGTVSLLSNLPAIGAKVTAFCGANEQK